MSFEDMNNGRCCCIPPKLPPHHHRPPELPDFYAQYGVMANPASGSEIPVFLIFQSGDEILLEGDDTLVLPEGYLYLINFIFQGVPEADSYMQIVPRLNGSLRALYSYFAPSGVERSVSASGSFTTADAAEGLLRLSFNLTYPDRVRNIDISGAISITPLQKL